MQQANPIAINDCTVYSAKEEVYVGSQKECGPVQATPLHITCSLYLQL